MSDSPQQPAARFDSFDGTAPPEVWAAATLLFTEAFAAAPYFEDPEELATIASWGPEQLAQRGGRLVVATSAGVMTAFALSHGLADDPIWQRILVEAAVSSIQGCLSLAPPESIVVLQELAVSPAYRGQGIARECVRLLLADRPETTVVLGVYEQAAAARSMYFAWGFEELGQTTGPTTGITLHVLGNTLPWPGPPVLR